MMRHRAEETSRQIAEKVLRAVVKQHAVSTVFENGVPDTLINSFRKTGRRDDMFKLAPISKEYSVDG